MYPLSLFLGVKADEAFNGALERANPTLVSLLTGGGDYLSELTRKEGRYIGKHIPLSSTVPQLESLETHLISLLTKLAPDLPHKPVLLSQIDDTPR